MAAALTAVAVTLAACGGSGSGATTTTTSTTVATHASLTLTQPDNGKTFPVHIPAQVRVVLPYEKSTNEVWQLASGGPGFSQDGPPLFTDSPGDPSQGIQTLRFTVAGAGMVPLLLDLAPPGPLVKPPSQQFRVTLAAT